MFLFCFWSSEMCILLLVVAMFLKTICDISSIFVVVFGGGAGEIFYINCQCQLDSNLIASDFIWAKAIRSSYKSNYKPFMKVVKHQSICHSCSSGYHLFNWGGSLMQHDFRVVISFFNPLASWCLKFWEVFQAYDIILQLVFSPGKIYISLC